MEKFIFRDKIFSTAAFVWNGCSTDCFAVVILGTNILDFKITIYINFDNPYR